MQHALQGVHKLKPDQLRNCCDPKQFKFETTAELDELPGVLGQERAVEAIRFGISIRREGYNLFAMGPQGSGKHSILRRFIEEKAAKEKVICDWCYVHNFKHAHKPRALKLPPGRARKFGAEMDRLIQDLRAAIPAAFETDDYRARRKQLEAESAGREEKAFAELRKKAQPQGIAFVTSPQGFAFAPLEKDEVMKPEVFQKLPEEERERIIAASEALQQEVQGILRQAGRWHRDTHEKIRELNRTVTRIAASGIIDDLKKEYADCPAVVEYLGAVSADVVASAEIFRQPKEGEQFPAVLGAAIGLHEMGDARFRRYRVNVFIDHGDSDCAPVIYEKNPTHDNLIGRIEHFSQMGVLVTDFMLIKPGALHRANGGYLILDALKVLTLPFAWDALKRALRSHEVRIESVGQMLSLVSTVSLDPEAIPLDVKIVLAGERLIFYLLHALDPEFEELFKVVADFEEDATRSADAAMAYAQLLGTLARKDNLRPLDCTAVARVIEESSRLTGDAEKLSMGVRRITDLMREADYFANVEKSKTIAAPHVQQAIEAQERRAGRIRERLQKEIQRGTLLIDTAGEKLAQVNGLSCVELGGFAFGYPSRITARVRLGAGKVVNIEREVELSGPIHSKGVLILSGYLNGQYVPDRPLTLSASLVFEQSYGAVEGDSASVAELCALLSALAGAPVRQSLAVTGSINQHGHVQAIGGVNQKIEGFFDVCKARGLSGEQGVLIPSANIKHLMLRQETLDAVAAAKFHVYAIDHIDEAMELLTGLPSGQRGTDGKFPEGTINHRVEKQLIEFAETARAFHALDGGHKG